MGAADGGYVLTMAVRTDVPTFAEIVRKTIASDRGVTFRTYGQNGEHRRPMVHRFPYTKLKGSVPMLEALVMESGNAFLARLQRKEGR